MEIKDWTVMKCNKCKRKSYFYGPLEEFKEDDEDFNLCCNEEMQILNLNDWDSEDIAQVFSNILEDNNYHSLTSLPQLILRNLEILKLTEREKRVFMNHFMYDFFDEKNIKI